MHPSSPLRPPANSREPWLELHSEQGSPGTPLPSNSHYLPLPKCEVSQRGVTTHTPFSVWWPFLLAWLLLLQPVSSFETRSLVEIQQMSRPALEDYAWQATALLTTFGLFPGTPHILPSANVSGLADNTWASGQPALEPFTSYVEDAQRLANDSNETRALLQMFELLGGRSWYNSSGWGIGSACAGNTSVWHGIQCTDNHITSLVLQGNNVVGRLSAIPLEALQRIQVIALSGNPLVGTLPSSWAALTSLQLIALTGNSLSGTLPASWAALTSLTDILLNQNQLKGTLPDSWTALTSLRTLGLNSNVFSGTLPNGWHVMTSLTSIYLFGNRLSGTLPASWAALTSLNTLLMSSNSLSGTIPDSWAALTSLTLISLNDNSLVGTVPSYWVPFNSLSYLDLSHNDLSGTVPSEWSGSLSYLDLSSNSLVGTLPDCGDGLYSSLISANFANNSRVTGSLPALQCDRTYPLVYFNIENTGIDGEIPPNLADMVPGLAFVNLRGTLVRLGPSIANGTSSTLRLANQLFPDNQQCKVLEAAPGKSSMTVLVTRITFFNEVGCPCAPNSYGLAGQCYPCQWSFSNCNLGDKLFVLPNVWVSHASWAGNASQHRMSFTRCPAGRCCTHPNTTMGGCLLEQEDNNALCSAVDRTGILCGQCIPGYTVVWGSEHCQPESNCHWGGVVLAGLGIVAACYVLSLLRCDNLLWGNHENDHLAWFTVPDAILLLGYFYQILPLVAASEFESLAAAVTTWAHSLQRILTSVVGLQLLSSSSGGLCLFPGMTSLGKLLFNFAFPFYVILWLGVCIGISTVYRRRHPNLPTLGEDNHGWYHPSRGMVALNKACTLGYMVLLKTTLSLLKCVPVVHSDTSQHSLVLFYTGELCWTWWQAVAAVLSALLALFPFLRIWISSRQWGRWGSAFECADRRSLHPSCLWWAGCLLLQRLSFQLLDTFMDTNQPVKRAWANSVLCALYLVLLHVVRPYRLQATRWVAETAQLLLLVISVGSLAEAESVEMGGHVSEGDHVWMSNVGVVLSFVPALWYLFCVTRLFLKWIWLKYRMRSKHRSSDLGVSLLAIEHPIDD